MKTLAELRDAYNAAVKRMNEAIDAVENAADDADLAALSADVDVAVEAADTAKADLEAGESLDRARQRHQAVDVPAPVTVAEQRAHVTTTTNTALGVVSVSEPDLYERGGRSFFADLYRAQLKGDREAQDRIDRHHRYEVEKRAVTSATLGGILPPAYLLSLYAKAPRNGRVYADQANHQVLPDNGMNVIIPRLTAGLSTGVQATENTAVTTSDPTETDLTVPVRTIAGYSPVSRQTLERNGYGDQILFEDLVARYQANVDSQCISGSGASGQILGVLNTAGISTSTASTATAVGIWPKIADLIQQINTTYGGLGYFADKIIMHPRRWGMFTAALDTANRPLYQPAAMTVNEAYESMNSMSTGGNTTGYGFVGAMIQGLPVYTDANIPTNLGVGTNEDRIIVQCSQVVHLWERDQDPVTLSFEQQAGTSLQVQLVAYGYAAFTAGRYPAASGVITGAGLVPPTF